MKILMFSDLYGGKNTFIHNQIKYFKERHEIKYIATKYVEPVGDIGGFSNFQIIPFERGRLINYLLWKLWNWDIVYITKNKQFASQLNKSLQEYNPDIIHLHFGIEAIKFLENIESCRAKLLIHFHGYDASSLLRKDSYVKELIKYSKKYNITFIFNCEYLKNQVLKKLNLTNNSQVIYFGSDIDFFQRKNLDGKNEKIIFSQVSSMVQKKGHINIIKSFKKLIDKGLGKNFRFIFTGTGGQEGVIKSTIKEFKLEKYFELVGHVNINEARDIYQKSNVFIHPSITTIDGDLEGTTTSIMEAMAMNLPILSTCHSGIPELVVDGENGILVEENNIEALSKAMIDISTWSLLDGNRARIVELFDIDKHNVELERLYFKELN